MIVVLEVFIVWCILMLRKLRVGIIRKFFLRLNIVVRMFMIMLILRYLMYLSIKLL